MTYGASNDYDNYLTPAEYHFTCKQGESFVRTFIYEDDEGNAVDISDWTARMDVRDADDENGTLIVSFTTANSRIVLGVDEDGEEETGGIKLVLTPTVSEVLTVGRHWCDLFLVDGSDSYCVIDGTFEVTPRRTAL